MPRAAKLEHLTLALLCDLEDAYATVQLAIARLGEPDRDTLGWDLERALVCLDALLERELGVELSPLSVGPMPHSPLTLAGQFGLLLGTFDSVLLADAPPAFLAEPLMDARSILGVFTTR